MRVKFDKEQLKFLSEANKVQRKAIRGRLLAPYIEQIEQEASEKFPDKPNQDPEQTRKNLEDRKKYIKEETDELKKDLNKQLRNLSGTGTRVILEGGFKQIRSVIQPLIDMNIVVDGLLVDYNDLVNIKLRNRRNVERKLKDKCRSDRARIQIGRISNFGLLEMSRQRLRESNVKWRIGLSNESFALKILKLVELKAVLNKAKFVDLKVCKKISDFLKENFIEDLTYFEKKNKMKIDIISDNSLIIPEYIIDIKNKSKKTIELIEQFERLKNLEEQKVNNVIELKDKKKFKKKTFRKRKYYKKAK